MKITKVEAIPLSIPFTYGGEGSGDHLIKFQALDYCLARVETDDGLVGWGDGFAYNCRNAVATVVRDMIAPLAIGRDASDIAGMHAYLQKRLHLFGRFGVQAYAISALDIALWDIAGKAANLPLHRLVGGARRTRIPCYASLLRYNDPQLVSRYAEQALGEGFTSIKLHEVADDAVAAGRGAVPAHVPLTVDVNCEWRPREAMATALRWREHELYWLEEPVFPPEDFRALREIGEGSGVDLAAGENWCFVSQFQQALEARAVQFVQPSVTKVGGVTECLKIIALAEAHNTRVALHSPYFGPGALATLHVLAAQDEPSWFEYFYLRADAKPYPGLVDAAQGALDVPTAPGLGADPDPNVIARYRVD